MAKFFEWNIDALPIPWDVTRPSIHGHVLTHIEPGKVGLREGGDRLPDEAVFSADEPALAFAPGALDGIISHHSADTNHETRVGQIFDTLGTALREPTAANLGALYGLLCDQYLLGLLDPLLEKIVAAKNADTIPIQRLLELAYLLAMEAPDRGPVKFAISVLGFSKAGGTSEPVLTLGRHEEFTLYSAIAIANQADEPERQLWELAKCVDGWGRVHCIALLYNAQLPEVRAWLLRDGFRNTVMHEYTAHTAANAGGLLEELRKDDPDDALLDGAGEILLALLNGQPGPGFEGYAGGGEAAELYVRHMQSRAKVPADFVPIAALRDFAGVGGSWDLLVDFGWSEERRAAIVTAADLILARPEWHAHIIATLGNDDAGDFWSARNAAQRLGIDTWEASFERQQRGLDDNWLDLLETDDPARIDRTLALAESIFPLDEIAAGIAPQRVRGRQGHYRLGYILRALKRFPGKGWPFIRAGLLNRHDRDLALDAIYALAEWDREAWPAEAVDIIEREARSGVDMPLRLVLARLLEGRPLDYDA